MGVFGISGSLTATSPTAHTGDVPATGMAGMANAAHGLRTRRHIPAEVWAEVRNCGALADLPARVRDNEQALRAAMIKHADLPDFARFELGRMLAPAAGCPATCFDTNEKILGRLGDALIDHPDASLYTEHELLMTLGLPSLLRNDADLRPGTESALHYDLGTRLDTSGTMSGILQRGQRLTQHLRHGARGQRAVERDYANVLAFHRQAAGLTGYSAEVPLSHADFVAHLDACKSQEKPEAPHESPAHNDDANERLGHSVDVHRHDSHEADRLDGAPASEDFGADTDEVEVEDDAWDDVIR